MFQRTLYQRLLLINPTPQSSAAAKQITENVDVLGHGKMIPSFAKLHWQPSRPLKPEDMHDLDIDFSQYSHIMSTHDASGKGLLPRLGAILNKSMVSDVTQIHASNEFTRLMFAGNVVSKVKANSDQVIVTIRPTAFPAETLSPSKSPTALSMKQERVVTVNVEQSGGDRPELGAAKVVVSGGRALKTKEDFDRLFRLT